MTASSAAATDSSWQSADDAPTPFWRRMPKFFALPLARPVLMRIGILSAIGVLSPLLWPLGFVGVLLFALLLLTVTVIGAQYGFTIIEQSSRGFLYPVEYPPQLEGASIGRPFRYVAIYVAFGGVALFVGLLSGSQMLTGAVYLLLAAGVAPAAVMRLVQRGSLFGALSPADLARTMARVGKPYLVLCLFVFFADLCRTYGLGLIASAGGVSAAMAALGQGKAAAAASSIAVAVFLMSVAFWYFTYMICALIGYAMYQFSGPLEITVVGPGEHRHGGRLGSRRLDMAKRTRDALIGKMVTAGELPEAIEMINDDLRNRPNDLSLHQRLHKLLLIEGYAPRIESHTERYLDLLMRTDNAREALPLVEEAFQRNPSYEPRELAHVVPLARTALAAGQPQLAAQLIRGFDKKHRMHPEIPYVYLIGAQVMLQTGGATAQARSLLEHLAAKFAQHPAGLEAQRNLQRLDGAGAPPVSLR